MKQTATRFLSLLLVCLLTLGNAAPALGESAGGEWNDQTYAALVQRLYGDKPPEAEMPVLIGGLKHIAGLGGDYIITKGLDTIWGWIFGTDDSSQQILASLERIERELTDMGYAEGRGHAGGCGYLQP